MFNALKYIKKLEEVGFPREQAEAQLQIVIDVIEGELATKEDVNVLKSDIKTVQIDVQNLRSDMQNDMQILRSDIKNDMQVLRTGVQNDMQSLRTAVKNDINSFRQEVAHQFTNQEYKIVTKLGVIVVTSVSLAVALSTWLIKLK